MSEQHQPARTPLPPDSVRRLKTRRDKTTPLTAKDFEVGDHLVTEYKTRSGRTARQLVQVIDVYDHSSLRTGWNLLSLFAKVVSVQEEAERDLVGHVVCVNTDKSMSWGWSRWVNLRTDLDWRQEAWL